MAGDDGWRPGARRLRGAGGGEVKETTVPVLLARATARVWARTTTPSTPRDAYRFLSQRGGSEGPGTWKPSAVCSPKGGKGELPFPIGSARLRLRLDACRHLAPSEAPQTNPIPGVP